jgi:hypothetical protein
MGLTVAKTVHILDDAENKNSIFRDKSWKRISN